MSFSPIIFVKMVTLKVTFVVCFGASFKEELIKYDDCVRILYIRMFFLLHFPLRILYIRMFFFLHFPSESCTYVGMVFLLHFSSLILESELHGHENLTINALLSKFYELSFGCLNVCNVITLVKIPNSNIMPPFRGSCWCPYFWTRV